MTTLQIYEGSDGDATKLLYNRLEALGPVGTIALNLFRAAKCSERAKLYSRKFRGEAYGRKQWSLRNLDAALTAHAEALGLSWGWKRDPAQALHCWVLYVDIPTGQVSFHTDVRASLRDYGGEWTGIGGGPYRIVNWCDRLLGESESAPVTVLTFQPVATQASLL